ncbi:MAG: MBL fold metallo-hydrolase [Conexivisphaera sp.]
MRLVVLVDNEPGPGLRADWGLSIYVDSGRWRALFDAGPDPAVLEHNAKALGIDLGSIDFAVLSHHHLDHVGGFLGGRLFSEGLVVYAPPGPVERLEDVGMRPVVIEGTREIAPGAHAVGPLAAGHLHEMAMAVTPGPGRGSVLLVGCSHPGVDALASRAASDLGTGVSMVVGGFHSPPRAVIDRLAGIADRICPGHCSGDEAKAYLRSAYPHKYCHVRSGVTLEL